MAKYEKFNYDKKSKAEMNLYGLLKAMESLETAWIRDMIEADEYQKMCQRLLSQKRELYDGEFKEKVGTLQKFASDLNIHASRAIRRFEKGVPATVDMLPSRGQDGTLLITVTQDILEFKDELYMEMTDIDMMIPRLNKIVNGLRGVKKITAETPELQKLLGWLGKLQNRPAHESLSKLEARELGLVAQSMLDRLKSSQL